jgi:hypothetical protein
MENTLLQDLWRGRSITSACMAPPWLQEWPKELVFEKKMSNLKFILKKG